MFADDTILFTRANVNMASKILECVHKYESWSGQQCSLVKSSVLFSKNVANPLKANILNVLKMASNLNRPWVKCLSEKHCKKASIWSTQARENNSAFWKGILSFRDVICRGGMTLVGRGDTVDIWKQPWIPWLDYCDFLNLMDQVRPRFPNLKSVPNISLDNGCWNVRLLKEMFGDTLGERIGRIGRLPGENMDVLVWKESTDGMFTVKRGYEASQALRPISSPPGEGLIRDSIMRRYLESLRAMEEDADIGAIAPTGVTRKMVCNTAEVFSVSDASWKEDKACLAVELLAIQWAMQLARQKGFKRYASASDAKVLIDALKKQICPTFRQLKPLALEVLSLCKLFDDCNFFFISRRDNSACDALAKWARQNSQCNGYIFREGSPIVIPNFSLQ
uniref:RNase H type-1 domain-containing protein n=1 Tax=Cannabis sativa TaxID=3483 RepID=A0A803NGX3_CANSA